MYFYKKYLNKLTKIKTLSKCFYFNSELKKHQCDPKKTLEVLRKLLPTKQASSLHTNELCGNSSIVDKCEEFNNLFCMIGKNLAEQVSLQQPQHFKTFLGRRIASSLFLDPPNMNEIVECILSLNVNKAQGHDNIAAFFLKSTPYVLANYLCHFIKFHLKMEFFLMTVNC